MISINLETLIALSRERHSDLLREAELHQLLQQGQGTKPDAQATGAERSQAKNGNLTAAFAAATREKLT